MRTDTLLQPLSPDFSTYYGGDTFYFREKLFHKKEKLGDGSYGEVFYFEADDHAQVAVKSELPHDNIFRSAHEFQQEASWYQTIYGLGIFSGDPDNEFFPHYILMPYFKGKLLFEMIYPTEKFLLSCWIEAAAATHHLHQQHHAIHCDVKSNNIIYTGKSQLIDFGLTLPTNELQNEMYDSVENRRRHRHLAPELFTKRGLKRYARPAQDIYALGILLQDLFSLFLHQENSPQPTFKTVETITNVERSLRQINPAERCPIPQAIYMIIVSFFSQIPHNLWFAQPRKLAHNNNIIDAWRASASTAITMRIATLEAEQRSLECEHKKSARKAQKIGGLRQLHSEIQVSNAYMSDTLIKKSKADFPELTAGVFSKRTKILLDELREIAPIFH